YSFSVKHSAGLFCGLVKRQKLPETGVSVTADPVPEGSYATVPESCHTNAPGDPQYRPAGGREVRLPDPEFSRSFCASATRAIDVQPGHRSNSASKLRAVSSPGTAGAVHPVELRRRPETRE